MFRSHYVSYLGTKHWNIRLLTYNSVVIFQTLARDLESREKQAAKAITQLKDTSDKLGETERQKAIITQQLDDVTKKLGDVSKELEKTLQELRGTQLSLQEAEKRKEEFKGRAQETVRQ